MYIGNRYLAGKRMEAEEMRRQPIRSEIIGEIFNRVRRRVGE